MQTPARDSSPEQAAWQGAFMAAAWIVLAVLLAGLTIFYNILDLHPAGLIALPIVAAAGIFLVAHTQSGLIFAAFAIAPLGIFQLEVASVTINLPEAIILALAAKEGFALLLRKDREFPYLPTRAISLYLAAALFILLYALLRGNRPVAAIQDFRQFTEYVLLYILLLITLKDLRQVRRITAAFVFGILVLAIHGILQRFTGIGIPGNQLLSDRVLYDSVRSGSFYGSTPLGALMVLGLGPAIGIALSTKSLVVRFFMAGAAATMITAAVFTNTRASWLAIAILLFIIFIGVRKTIPLIAITLAVVVLFSVALGPTVARRMQTLEVSRAESSLLERIRYYTTAWHIFQYRPLTGIGWGRHYDGTTILANDRYVPVKLENRPRHLAAPQATVHSAYLQLLVKGGLIVLTSFLVLLAACAAPAWRAFWRPHADPEVYHLYLGLVAAVTGYLFHSTFENFFQWPVMSQSFWLIMALIAFTAHALLNARPPSAGAPGGTQPDAAHG